MTRCSMMPAVLLLAACGANGMSLQGTSASTGCQVILSGGVEASTDQVCTVEAINPSADAGVAFTIAANGTSYGTFSYAAELTGPVLMTGTFGLSGPSAVIEATTKLLGSTSQEWDQSLHASSPDTGTTSLEVSTIGSATTAKGETTWTGCHGNLAVTLTPAMGGDAGIDVTARLIF
jgi:hypothetical protein